MEDTILRLATVRIMGIGVESENLRHRITG
jgi:hypothetical protein